MNKKNKTRYLPEMTFVLTLCMLQMFIDLFHLQVEIEDNWTKMFINSDNFPLHGHQLSFNISVLCDGPSW